MVTVDVLNCLLICFLQTGIPICFDEKTISDVTTEGGFLPWKTCMSSSSIWFIYLIIWFISSFSSGNCEQYLRTRSRVFNLGFSTISRILVLNILSHLTIKGTGIFDISEISWTVRGTPTCLHACIMQHAISPFLILPRDSLLSFIIWYNTFASCITFSENDWHIWPISSKTLSSLRCLKVIWILDFRLFWSFVFALNCSWEHFL